MKKITLFLLGTLMGASSFAQITTPGNGENYDLSELSTMHPTALSFDGTTYTLSENLTIAVDDTLEITTSETLFMDTDILITVEGALITDAGQGNQKLIIRSTDTLMPADGIRFEEFSVGSIKNTEITYTGGVRVLTADFIIEDCYLAHNVSGASTGAVVSISRGPAVVKNNTFYKNDLPAVGSGANQEVPALIIGNLLDKNSQTNQNRPQINMGPTGADTLRIIDNTIIGDPSLTKVGGIAISNFVGANINTIIENNVIQNNRYGLTIAGPNANALIKGNIIEDNNTQNDPNQGGSGISVNSDTDSQNLVLRENKIRRNLWGITVIGQASVDLGTSNDLGNNLFSENGNNGVTYALYNNTALDINALGNCWIETNENADATAIEEVIFHKVDDASLGNVDFSNWSCGILSVDQLALTEVNLYPNPAHDKININNTMNFEVVTFFNVNGQLIKTVALTAGQNQIDLDLPQGLYMLQFRNNNQRMTKKLMVK